MKKLPWTTPVLIEIISRKDAKARGLKRYFTGKPCERGHFSERYVSVAHCVECQHEHSREQACQRREANPEYTSWAGMKTRCNNPNSSHPKDYGGRGIRVCGRWLNSYANFIADMGPRPTPAHSLDRYPNNDGDYEPTNCRWATWAQQTRNKRNNVMIEIDGRKQCATDWAKEAGLGESTIRGRANSGWPVEQLLNPAGSIPRRRRKLDPNSIRGRCRALGVLYQRTWRRMRVGMTFEQASE